MCKREKEKEDYRTSKGTCFGCLHIFSFICRVVVYWLLVLCSRRRHHIHNSSKVFPFLFFRGPAITRRETDVSTSETEMDEGPSYFPVSLFILDRFFLFLLFVFCLFARNNRSFRFVPFDSRLVCLFLLYPAKMSFPSLLGNTLPWIVEIEILFVRLSLAAFVIFTRAEREQTNRFAFVWEMRGYVDNLFDIIYIHKQKMADAVYSLLRW